MQHRYSASIVLLFILSLVAPMRVAAQISFSRSLTLGPALVGGDSRGVSWIDVNGDGYDDLFVTRNQGQSDLVFLNDGDGNLVRSTTGEFVQTGRSNNGQCWADYDNDGDVDLVTVGSQGTFLFKNDGAGILSSTNVISTFGVSSVTGWACAWGDMDRDGFVDLVVTHPAGFVGGTVTSNWLFKNRGDGSFEHLTSTPVDDQLAPFTIPSWYDFDLDGDLDLFIGAGPANSIPGLDFIYLNQLVETGSFSLVKQTTGPIANGFRDGQVINWVDIDNDRDLDAFITNWGGGMLGGLADELFRNNDGMLSKETGNPLINSTYVSLGQTWGDFDNDGDLDVLIAEGNGSRPNQLFSNDGLGQFTRVNSPGINAATASSWGVAASDFDDDGDLDIAVANTGSSFASNFFFVNDYAGSNGWLKVRLEGIQSNRSGIGSRVHIKTTMGSDVKWQVRDVSSQNSFNGMNSLVQHFGLGSATSVDSLVVEWPSGYVTKMGSQQPNQTLTIVESQATSIESLPEIPGEEPKLVAYPNPARAGESLRLSREGDSIQRVRIVSLMGRDVGGFYSELDQTFKLPEVSSGLYFILVESTSGLMSIPIYVLR